MDKVQVSLIKEWLSKEGVVEGLCETNFGKALLLKFTEWTNKRNTKEKLEAEKLYLNQKISSLNSQITDIDEAVRVLENKVN